jgi:hypothetical protein
VSIVLGALAERHQEECRCEHTVRFKCPPVLAVSSFGPCSVQYFVCCSRDQQLCTVLIGSLMTCIITDAIPVAAARCATGQCSSATAYTLTKILVLQRAIQRKLTTSSVTICCTFMLSLAAGLGAQLHSRKIVCTKQTSGLW